VTEKKIRGKFYPLQTEEWVTLTAQLRYAEIKVLLYLKTLEPFGNAQRVNVSDTAQILGMGKGTASKALKVLQEKGLIELEIEEATVKVRKGFLQETRFPGGNGSFLEETRVSCGKHPESPEPIAGASSGDSVRDQDLIDKEDPIRSLSERENASKENSVSPIGDISDDDRTADPLWQEFASYEMRRLPQQPVSPAAWLARHGSTLSDRKFHNFRRAKSLGQRFPDAIASFRDREDSYVVELKTGEQFWLEDAEPELLARLEEVPL